MVPFRFEATWITHPDYLQLVETAWKKENDNVIACLNQVREDSIVFNTEILGNIRRKKQALERRIKVIQKSHANIDFSRLVYLE